MEERGDPKRREHNQSEHEHHIRDVQARNTRRLSQFVPAHVGNARETRAIGKSTARKACQETITAVQEKLKPPATRVAIESVDGNVFRADQRARDQSFVENAIRQSQGVTSGFRAARQARPSAPTHPGRAERMLRRGRGGRRELLPRCERRRDRGGCRRNGRRPRAGCNTREVSLPANPRSRHRRRHR